MSARKSYLELLLKQIDSTSGVSFGFSDVSHFSRAFKAAFGRSPHQVME